MRIANKREQLLPSRTLSKPQTVSFSELEQIPPRGSIESLLRRSCCDLRQLTELVMFAAILAESTRADVIAGNDKVLNAAINYLSR
jgi:hypothetical protein